MVISIIVALHVIPVTIVILFLSGVFTFHKTPDADSQPEVVVVKTTTKTVEPPRPIPPKPPEPINGWDLPPVLPPAGLQSLIVSGAYPPLPAGGAALPARMTPLVRDFETKHVGPVFALAVMPGGKYLLSAGADRHIRVWDTATVKEVKVFDGTSHVVRSLTVNGLGNIAASGGDDGAVRVWDVALGKEAFTLTGHAGSVRGVAFSPNGGYILSGGEDGTLRLWDVQTKEAVRNLKVGQPITCLAFCPDGRRALVGGESGTVAIFDLEAARPLHTATGHIGAAVTAVAFSPDGREAVSVGEDKKLHLWDVATGAKLPIGTAKATAIAYAQPLRAVAYAGDGSWVVAAVADSSAAVIQPHGKGRARISLPPAGKPLALAVAPDGLAAYVGTDQGAVRRLDFQGGADAVATGAARSDEAPMTTPTPTPTPIAQRPPSQAPKWTAEGGAGTLRTLAVAANGRSITGGTDRNVRVWDPDGKEVHSFGNMTGIENNVAISRDGGTILVGGNSPTQIGRILVGADCLLRVVSLKTGKAATVGAHISAINCLALSPSGRYALTGCQTVVRYWDATTSREIRQYIGHTGTVRAVDFNPNSKQAQAASVAADNTVRIWDLNGTRLIRTIMDLPGTPQGVAYSPDGKLILVWGAGVLGTWDAVTGKQVTTVTAGPSRRTSRFTAAVGSACWTPDGNILVGSASGVTLVDAATGKELRQFDGAPALVDAVGISGDGRLVLAAGRGLCAWEMDKPLAAAP
jgi:WD40 repeat protein